MCDEEDKDGMKRIRMKRIRIEYEDEESIFLKRGWLGGMRRASLNLILRPLRLMRQRLKRPVKPPVDFSIETDPMAGTKLPDVRSSKITIKLKD